MRSGRCLMWAIALAAPSLLLGQAPGKSAAGANAASRLVVMPAADLKWTDLDPTGAPGVKLAVLWGNPAAGPFGGFLKLPAGFAAPLHTHSTDLKVVIISGTYVQAPEGKPEFRIGAGSYFMQPGGDYRHTTSCAPGADCVLFFEGDGKFDIMMVGAPAPASTKP